MFRIRSFLDYVLYATFLGWIFGRYGPVHVVPITGYVPVKETTLLHVSFQR